MRHKWLTQQAKDAPCMHCGRNDGTTVAAHYTGPRQHMLGKGTGIKCHDAAAAFLCSECHTDFDQYKKGDKWLMSEEFLFAIVKTWIYRVSNEMVRADK